MGHAGSIVEPRIDARKTVDARAIWVLDSLLDCLNHIILYLQYPWYGAARCEWRRRVDPMCVLLLCP